MNQGTKIVAVVLFVLFTGTAIYYVTLSPAKPASPAAPKATETPAKAPDRDPGSITMNPPTAGEATAVAAPATPRIVDPLAATTPVSGPSATAATGASTPGQASSPVAGSPTAPPRVTLGPGGTPSAVMPPLNVTRPAASTGTSGGVSGSTSPTASPVRPTAPVAASASTSTAAPSSSESASAREHVVASGETLSSIAARYLGSEARWEDIAKANPGVNPNAMRVGTKLSIPASTASATSTSKPLSSPSTATGATASGSTSPSDREYVVKAGDTLTGIARATLGNADWESIYEANRSVIGPNPAALKVGMKLSIPKRS